MAFPESAEMGNDPQPTEVREKRQELLNELRQFATAIKKIDGGEKGAEPNTDSVALPRVFFDKRGRPNEVWDCLGRQLHFFYSDASGHPYAYEIRDHQRRTIERGSTTGPGNIWSVFHSEAGLEQFVAPKHIFPHPVVRVEVTQEGAMLVNASDGYQIRRDPTGVEFAAQYDNRGCLIEAVRRDIQGVDRTVWTYDEEGNTYATENKPDGAVIESGYDRWGRMLCRREVVAGQETATTVQYNDDGSHKVKRTVASGEVVEELRRIDGSLARVKIINLHSDEVTSRVYDEQERLLEEEHRNRTTSEITSWRYGNDGWTEVSSRSSEGKSLEARYDSWGRLVLQRESTPTSTMQTTFSYKPDGSSHMHRKTSDGLEADEYYRPDGSRIYSKAVSSDGHVVEVDYDSTGRPLKRISTVVHRYQA